MYRRRYTQRQKRARARTVARGRRPASTVVQRVTAVMPKLSVPRRVFGFPDSLVTKLKYGSLITLTSTSNSLARQVYEMGNVYDPDYSGIGHQPMFFDQYTPIYNKYVVLGSVIKATFSPIANTTGTSQPSGPMLIGIIEDYDTSLAATNAEWLIESNKSKSTFLNVATGGNNVKTIMATYSPQTSLGIAPDDDTVASLVSGNPSSRYFVNVFMTETGLATPSSCNVKVEIEYTVRFFNQKDVGQS